MKRILTWFILFILALLLGTLFRYYIIHYKDMHHVDSLWNELNRTGSVNNQVFDPASLDSLPELARRYFAYHITPGTSIPEGAVLSMSGTFRLGDKWFPMEAQQVFSGFRGFVWKTEIGSGLLQFSGADSYFEGEGAMSIWLWKVIPVVRVSGDENISLAAAGRLAIEASWQPWLFLPQYGASWREVSANVAAVTVSFAGYTHEIFLEIGPEGQQLGASMMRWSNENPAKEWRWMKFGSKTIREETFSRITIPSEIEVGWNYGTDLYAPFFRAKIVDTAWNVNEK